MKKIQLFFYILIVSVLLTSCSEDEAATTPENSSIVGAWKMTEYSGTTESNSPGIAIVVTSEGSDFDDVITTFTENPNMVSTTGNFVMAMTTTITVIGSDPYTTTDIRNVDYVDAEAVSWEIVNGNEIATPLLIPENLDDSINLDGMTTEIVELTDTSLKLKLSGTVTVTQSGQSMPANVEYQATYVRQ